MERIRPGAVYCVTLPGTPPSNNQYMGNSRSHFIYSKEKRKWEKLVAEAFRGNAPERPLEKAVVELNYTFPDRRRRDPDNYSGKMILDGLVACGVIEDDSFSNVSLFITARSVPGVRVTAVKVTEVESL